MARFPDGFVDDLKAQVDIVQVVQDHVPLRKAGASYKGLCPFHGEKTPSFHVHPDKGFFHCFGCGVGGDVVKFVELQDKLTFPDAVRHLAQRFGVEVPESDDPQRDAAADARREALLKLHELATDYFRDQLRGPAGAGARRALADRDVSAETIEKMRLGYAPGDREGLKRHLLERGQSTEHVLASGLVVERDGGRVLDRFRNRLMIPICRDSGSVVAFGGRALEPGQQPKYLNSPETPLYTKGRTLYGLDMTKTAIRRVGYAVVVEGYFDLAQALQAGVGPVVATCGTAVTDRQVRLLKRFATRVILSFDPDAAGDSAAAKTGELLLAEDFDVKVARLAEGEDPDTAVRTHGAAHYRELLRTAAPYLEYVQDRAAARHDLSRPDERRTFLSEMLAIAAKIPDAAARDQFGDRLAHTARVMEEVVRTEIRRAAVGRRTTVPEASRAATRVTPAERALIWATMHDAESALSVLVGLEPEDFEGLATTAILKLAASLAEWPPETVAETLLTRLDEPRAQLVRRIASEPVAPAEVEESATSLRLRRYEREREEIQRQLDQHERSSGDERTRADAIDVLVQRKADLFQLIRALKE